MEVKGFVVSDLYSIEGIHQNHFVASTMKEAAVMALSAGVDIDLGGDAYMNLMDAVNRKEISKEILDAAVSRVLRLKFEMGLFENPYVDPGKAKKEVRSKEYVTLARQVAQASITLLKNEHSLLPLDRSMKVALIGPNANNRYNMLGDYTAPQEEENVKTVWMESEQNFLPHRWNM